MYSPRAASSSSSLPSPSSPSSRLHEASLVESRCHHPAMDQLRALPVSEHLITYLVDCVAEVVQHAMIVTHAHQQQPQHPITTLPPRLSHDRRDSLTTFVSRVLTASKASTPMLLVALVYIHRARPHLRVSVDEWALERVFLGALILASKYTNDVGLKNRHWAACTSVFGRRDVSRVEREFLEVLDFELGVSELDILRHYAGLTLQAKGRSTFSEGEELADDDSEMWEMGSEGGWSEDDDSDEESEGPITPACENASGPDYFVVGSPIVSTHPSGRAPTGYPVAAPVVAPVPKSVSFYAAADYFAAKQVPQPSVAAFALHHQRPLTHPHAAIAVPHLLHHQPSSLTM